MERTPEEIRIKKLLKKISRKMGTTLRDHAMIREGDRILVGLSGGKDSMILLEALKERQRAMPFSFEIMAAHVEATGIGYEINREKMDQFCLQLEVPLIYRTIEPDVDSNATKSACFICSWDRRKTLFNLTNELDCNKLALGHHRQDAIETLLLNMVYHGSISSLPYTLKMFDGRVQLIRPLLDMDERILIEYASLNQVVKVEKKLPTRKPNPPEQYRKSSW